MGQTDGAKKNIGLASTLVTAADVGCNWRSSLDFHISKTEGVGQEVKKHIKQGQGHEGGIFSVEAPLHVSNVQVLDPVTRRSCKIGFHFMEDGSKVRIARGQEASGAIIPRPDILKERRKPRPTIVGPKDTPIDAVLEKTYDPKAGIGMPKL